LQLNGYKRVRVFVSLSLVFKKAGITNHFLDTRSKTPSLFEVVRKSFKKAILLHNGDFRSTQPGAGSKPNFEGKILFL
jgi:hypothetical protein